MKNAFLASAQWSTRKMRLTNGIIRQPRPQSMLSENATIKNIIPPTNATNPPIPIRTKPMIAIITLSLLVNSLVETYALRSSIYPLRGRKASSKKT
jgi:hypothetical protein